VRGIPQLDWMSPPSPEHPISIIPDTSIIPHTSAYGEISCFPAGWAPCRDRRRSCPRPRVVRRAVARSAIRSNAAGPKPPVRIRFRDRGSDRRLHPVASALRTAPQIGPVRSTGSSNAPHPLVATREPGGAALGHRGPDDVLAGETGRSKHAALASAPGFQGVINSENNLLFN
jgi:hypothetical protein